jgi:hypothetical protein
MATIRRKLKDLKNKPGKTNWAKLLTEKKKPAKKPGGNTGSAG